MNIINTYWIGKPEKDDFSKIEEHLLKISSKYSKISQTPVINREIIKRQSSGNIPEIEQSYSNALEKYISQVGTYNIILDPLGKSLTTEKFAKIFDDNPKINFFIGGAYGFSRDFLKKGDIVLTLSDLTMSHKIAKIVLFEQIYRALTINNNHPYHK
jgi:23S rRNA (pseudouridine1915-N3)-methyltransferase